MSAAGWSCLARDLALIETALHSATRCTGKCESAASKMVRGVVMTRPARELLIGSVGWHLDLIRGFPLVATT
jgi:hypothetical protein